MTDDQRMTVDELKQHLGTLSDPEDIKAFYEGEERETAKAAIESRLREVTEQQNAPRKARAQTSYPREELISGAAGFGVSPATMAGALAAAELEEATKDEATAAIEAWNEREV